MLISKVSLHDIDDVEAFVIMCVKRSGCGAPPDQWEELVAEGICLLYRMAGNYKERMPGYTASGRFSGYAVKWLPRQIAQAWHKSQEHHLYVKDPETKKRRWTYRLAPVLAGSIDDEKTTLYTIEDWVDVPTVELDTTEEHNYVSNLTVSAGTVGRLE